MQKSGATADDARLKRFNDAVGSKMLLRQATFHLPKGIERMFFFSTDFNYAEMGCSRRNSSANSTNQTANSRLTRAPLYPRGPKHSRA